MKPVKKYIVYKCKFSLSLALLYLTELFINKLKTKFNSFFFLQNGFKYKENSSFDEISPKELDKCIQKFYLSARKRDGRSVIARQNCDRWQQ